MWLVAQLVDQRPQNARLAYAGFSHQQHTLAFAMLGLLPTTRKASMPISKPLAAPSSTRSKRDAARFVRHKDRAGRSVLLETRCQVWGFAGNHRFLGLPLTQGLTDNDQPGGDADAMAGFYATL